MLKFILNPLERTRLMNSVKVGNITIGKGNPLAVIAGPCVIEDKDLTFKIAEEVKKAGEESGLPIIFKASFDKANRSSIRSYRGPGLEEGLEILSEIKETFKIPVLTDIHETGQASLAAKVVDVIQIPAFLCRQTDLLIASGETGIPVNVKKGQFLAPWDMKNIIEKLESTGNENILLTDRGTSFGYNNLVLDFRAIPIMQGFGYPVVSDITHALQLPGGLGDKTGGNREFVPNMARACVAAGTNSVFLEVHPKPDEAKSDSANSFELSKLSGLLKELKAIQGIIQG